MMSPTIRNTIKVVFLVMITIAMMVALSSLTIAYTKKHDTIFENSNIPPSILLPSRRVSRFLAQNGNSGTARNPNAVDHCNKDNEICNQLSENGKNSTCCDNKCMNLYEDDKNCGACKNKCKFTQHCCRGQCVDLSYDPRFCGSCYNKCLPGEYCIYGMCDYA